MTKNIKSSLHFVFFKCRLLFRVRLADKGFGVKISSFGKAKSGTGYLLTYMEL